MKTKKLFSVKKNFSFCKVAIVMSLLVSGAFLNLNAQVTIGSNAAPNATLDVVASDISDATVPEGIITPRLSLTELKAKDAAYGPNQTGAIVYVTNATGGTTDKTKYILSAPCHYWFDGSVWRALGNPPLNITPVQPDSYVVTLADDVILLNWTVAGRTITLPGEAEGVPVGKIIHISNVGSGSGAIVAGPTDVRVSAYRTIDQRSDYAFRYIGNNIWISMTSY